MKSGCKSISVSQAGDVIVAKRTALEMSKEAGFDETSGQEIGLAASELATNLVKHAAGGTILISIGPDERGRGGIRLEAVDQGPGIRDVERAMADGFSTAGSLGCGLGAVNRFMDDFDISSSVVPPRGTRVVAGRWVRTSPTPGFQSPLDVGSAARAHPGLDLNGDALVIKHSETVSLVAIIDGLGHGQFAHRASSTAAQYITNHFEQPLADIFRGVSRACRATRGVVMALARFDRQPPQLTFASVGNIEARILNSPQPIALRLRRGIIGLNAPNPLINTYDWTSQNILVMHTDGLSAHWKWNDFQALAEGRASDLAQAMLRKLAKDNDDAAVVVIKNRRPSGENRERLSNFSANGPFPGRRYHE